MRRVLTAVAAGLLGFWGFCAQTLRGDNLALEAVKPEVLAQNATLMAMTAFWIADRPERLAAPWPAERTAKMLRAQGQYEFLKAFNLWRFGDLGAEKKDQD